MQLWKETEKDRETIGKNICELIFVIGQPFMEKTITENSSTAKAAAENNHVFPHNSIDEESNTSNGNDGKCWMVLECIFMY